MLIEQFLGMRSEVFASSDAETIEQTVDEIIEVLSA